MFNRVKTYREIQEVSTRHFFSKFGFLRRADNQAVEDKINKTRL